jgi:two-component sensor histidine kinase
VIGLIDIGALPVGAACMPSNGSLREPPALEGLSLASLTSHHVESASALAIIAASNEPLLYLAEDLTVIAASASFCRAFEIEPSSIPGRALSRLGAGEWDRPQLISLLKATASGNAHVAAYDIDLARKGRKTLCLVVNAHRLDDKDDPRVRLLMAVSDVTFARAEAKQKDDLIQEKAILLLEVQHRVANSLQIIASILMQSARKVQSEEARGHLKDAHIRMMSIAAVQRYLAISPLADVPLAPYLTQLCESLGASMIYDPTQLSIRVNVDNSVTSATTSVSLGLIVTELVINALKHAFPENRSGKIVVSYRSVGKNWTLSVSDNGVGMRTGPIAAKAGLGTSIVQALSKQLNGSILIEDAQPGTAFSLSHDEAVEVAVLPAA